MGIELTGNTSETRVRDLFERIAELPAEERAWALRKSCPSMAEVAAVSALLKADDRQRTVLDAPAMDWLKRLDDYHTEVAAMIGETVGAYRIVELLGRGGSSIVFRATRRIGDAEQVVALKLLHSGLFSQEARRRFRREQSIMTQISHPNIARLIDGGVTNLGIPYIAMEEIDGTDLISHAQAYQLDGASRLRLLIELCRAVDAAHRALIVHRDLKPSNVLVSAEGHVKVLDFGIAKLLDDDQPTATQHIALTPGYAAPEQYQHGPATTSTDVYALGVLASELLIGARLGPDATWCDPDTRAAGRQQWRRLDTELGHVLRKALASDPENRYSSAGHLADDILRYLRKEPVAASPPSRRYRARKFIARHRVAVALSAAITLAILSAFGLALWQTGVARQEAVRANTVRDFVVGLFDAARAHLPRDQRPTSDVLVEQAEQQLRLSAQMDPSTRGEILRTLGEVNLSLSNFSRAQSLFDEAQAVAEVTGDINAEHGARILHADVLQRQGKNDEAIRELQERLQELRKKPSPLLLHALGVLAAAEMATGAPAAAIEHRREASGIANDLYGKDCTDAMAIGFAVGNALGDAQQYPEAISSLDPLLARWRALRAPEDDRYVAALATLTVATDGIGDTQTTEARLRELLTLKRRIYNSPHEEIARTLRDLGIVVARTEKYAEAQALFDEALGMQFQVYGQEHREIAATYNAMGTVLSSQRRFADADARYRGAIAICTHGNIKEEVCATAHNNLAQSLYRQNQLDEAKKEALEALAERRSLFGNDHPTTAYSLSTLSNIALKQNDGGEASRLALEALAALDRAGRGMSQEAVLVRTGYVQALQMLGDNEGALREIRQTLADWERVSPEDRTRRVSMLVQEAQIEANLGRADEARRTADAALALKPAPENLSDTTKKLLRELSGREDAI